MDHSSDTSELDDSATMVLDDLRKRTYRELHVYYCTEMGLNDYSQRLGNLMTIAHMAHVCSFHCFGYNYMKVNCDISYVLNMTNWSWSDSRKESNIFRKRGELWTKNFERTLQCSISTLMIHYWEKYSSIDYWEILKWKYESTHVMYKI